MNANPNPIPALPVPVAPVQQVGNAPISCNLVILDDNYVIRGVIKNELYRCMSKLFPSVIFDLYSSDDGVGGLGYVFITKPKLVIVDTTLPRYSGKEIFEFLRTNQATSLQDSQVILISEYGTDFGPLPNNFLILDKSQSTFLDTLITVSASHLMRFFATSQQPNTPLSVNISFLGKFVVFMANIADKIDSPNMFKKTPFYIITKPFAWFIWVLIEVFTVPFLIAYNLSVGNLLGESQIKTANPNVNYRSSKKPQFMKVLENITFTVFKLVLFLIINIIILLVSREL